MPWKEASKTMIREEFIKRVLSHEKTKSELCREYSISRPTGDKWIKRFLNGEDLDDRSKAPFKTANKTDSEIEHVIMEYRRKHPAIGAVKIHKILQNKGYNDIPCASTINAILKRNNLITKEASLNATPYKRFQKENPNDMWQADFKGNFALKCGERCHPLNIIDDCSRFNICSKSLPCETYNATMPVFIQAFKEYGLPKALLCDNGNPWGTSQSTGYTRFEVQLMDLGILTVHGRILHPQTQGKEESFNRSLTREMLKYHEFTDLDDVQVHLDEYRQFYNNERPHHALALDVPSQHYHKSNREYPSKIRDWEYSKDCILRSVKNTGYISYDGQGYFLSEAFGGKTVALRQSTTDINCLNVYYRQFKIAGINMEKRAFESKKIYLSENDPRNEPK